MAAQQWDVLMERCPSRQSLARIANKWTALIVICLGDRAMRFGELRDRVEGISAKVLTDTLRELERDGLVSRRDYAEQPPRVEYDLTDLGRTLFEPLQALTRWAEAHVEEVERARDDFDRVLLAGADDLPDSRGR